MFAIRGSVEGMTFSGRSWGKGPGGASKSLRGSEGQAVNGVGHRGPVCGDREFLKKLGGGYAGDWTSSMELKVRDAAG